MVMRTPWSSFAARLELHQTDQKSPRPQDQPLPPSSPPCSSPLLLSRRSNWENDWISEQSVPHSLLQTCSVNPALRSLCVRSSLSPSSDPSACFFFFFSLLNLHNILALPMNPSLPPEQSWDSFVRENSRVYRVSEIGFPLRYRPPPTPSPRLLIKKGWSGKEESRTLKPWGENCQWVWLGGRNKGSGKGVGWGL